jgi:hypothetical protein
MQLFYRLIAQQFSCIVSLLADKQNETVHIPVFHFAHIANLKNVGGVPSNISVWKKGSTEEIFRKKKPDLRA